MNGENLELRRQLCSKIQQVRTTLDSLEGHLQEIDRDVRRLEADARADPQIASRKAPCRVDPDLSTGTPLAIAAG